MPNHQFDPKHPERGWQPAEPIPDSFGMRLERAMRRWWRRLRGGEET